MKFLPHDPEIELYVDGFDAHDVLHREKAGRALSDLVNRIDDPMVIALDGRWGTGKSYFLKRWVGSHKQDSDCTVLFFDAFEHDYLSDPLPALIAELSKQLPESKAPTFEKAKKAAFALAKPAAKIALSLATFGATKELDEVGDVLVEAASNEASSTVDSIFSEYWKQEKSRGDALNGLRSAIAELASKDNEEKSEDQKGASIVIVIDELDRCRPDFALELLEVIKHFFSVPHVHFVLGVNLEALENTVRARYGAGIDARAYLQKFINLQMELPDTVAGSLQPKQVVPAYLEHLISETEVPNHIAAELTTAVKLAARVNSVSLRDVRKIVSTVSILSSKVLESERHLEGWLLVLTDLIVARVIDNKTFECFLNADITKEDLGSYFGVTELSITEYIGEEFNRDNFDRDLFYRYYCWLYIVEDSEFGLLDKESQKVFGRLLDRFGSPTNRRTLPKQVNEMWINQFSFFEG